MLEKTFQPKDIESKFTKKWEELKVFQAQPDSDKPPFTIMMPPPNVTGSLHIGHALNHSLQDILCRYKRMTGHDVLWQPGMDHASIAVHMVLERQFSEQGKSRCDFTREEFLEKAWEWKEKSGGMIRSQLKRLGTSPDWSRERFTMDEGLSAAVLKTFKELYDQGLIYRAKKLVNWDPERGTVISDLEVLHRDIRGKMYHFHYPFEDGSGHISIATTRPETILADGAVAVHPDDERYKDLVGRNVVVPIVNRIIPIVADEYVKADFGSGAVKITPAHDFNDYEVYQRHKDKGIPLINLFTPDAKMNETCPSDYVGLDRFEARKRVVADFEALDLLDKIEDHTHQVPYGERSGVVIEPYLTDQWFCDTPSLAKEAGAAVREGGMEFVPKQYENMYFDWIDNQIPWCISRQLWWGHRIPAFYGPDDHIFVAQTREEAEEKARAHYGEAVELRQDEDVLDTWFSSALWAHSTLDWPDQTPELAKYYPTDVLVTGFDIITFWVSRMMMMSLHFMKKEVPFKKVYVHALVRDSKGQKMSKSKGNIVDPIEIIERYGADALRFTLTAMEAQGRDIKLSESRIEGYRNFATKLWNAARYCQMKNCVPIDGFNPQNVRFPLNRWIVSELQETQVSYQKSLDNFRFNEAANNLYHFIWGTFCDWYLEFTKPVLNDADQDGAQDEIISEVRAVTGWVLDQALILLNPIMPFITEELYASAGEAGDLDKRDLLVNTQWPQSISTCEFSQSVDDVNWLKEAISSIRSVRADMNVPAGARIDLLIKDADEQTEKRVYEFKDILLSMARLSSAEMLKNMSPKGAIQTIVGGATFLLPIADVIDINEEKQRLKREIEKLTLNIKKVDQKLSNQKFLENAPNDVVEEQKARKEEAQSAMDKLSRALEQIEAA